MSLDDHILKLTNSITEELRAPIQESLRRLLSEVLATAVAERAASEGAWDQARGDLEARIATLRDDYQVTQAAAESQREELLGQHAAEVVALQTQYEADRQATEQALREELAREHEARLAEAREEAIAEAREQASAEHQAAEQALRDEYEARFREAAEDHERAIAQVSERVTAEVAQSVLVEARQLALAEHEAAEQSLRDEYEARLREAAEAHERAIAQVTDQVTAEVGQAVLAEARMLALEEQKAAEQAVRDEYEARLREAADVHERAIAELRDQVTAEIGQAVLTEARKLAAEDPQAGLPAQSAAGLDCYPAENPAVEGEALYTGRMEPARERLLHAIKRLDQAHSLTETLGQLMEHVSENTGRTAIFLVNGDRVRCWRVAGLTAPDATEADLSFDQAGAIGAAARSGETISTSDDHAGAASLPSWLQPPAAGRTNNGLAVPIPVGARIVAVLYADDEGKEGRAAEGNWREVTEIIARHAGRCLEVLTFARFSTPRPAQAVRSLEEPHPSAALGPDSDTARQEESARRYARLLISEVKLYNETTVEEGRQQGDILARLGPEVERARRLYEEKIPAVVRERAGWFDEELVRTLAGGDAGLLGQVT